MYGVNHYLDIMKEQFACLKSSGVYDECVDVSVGFIGDIAALKQAKEFLKQYPKASIKSYSPNEKEYEFLTLRLLKHDADVSRLFFALYIHTKGVTYPSTHEAFYGGQFWRHYMNDFVIKRWRQHYNALCMKEYGYDCSGCKVIPKRKSASGRTHISGNFFWANSEYVKTLKSLNRAENRFEAEMWVTSNEPIIYTNCNLFVDYNMRHENYEQYISSLKTLSDYQL